MGLGHLMTSQNNANWSVGTCGSVGALIYAALSSPPLGNTQFFQYLGVTSIVRTVLGGFCLRAPTIKELVGEKTAVALGY